jgi:hypothetical protein
LKIYTTFPIYVIVFGLTQFGKDNTYWRLAESDATVTPSVACMDWLHCWYNQVAGVVPPSTALALVTKMSEKCKSASPNAVPVKNQWKTIGIDEKLDIINWPEKSEQFCVISHTLDLLIAAYVQFVIMLIELQKVLSQ